MKKMFLYQLINCSPQKTTIENPRIINGPKGMGSFLSLIFIINKNIDIIAPNINDKKIVRNIFFIPKINPSEAIKVTSPSPIPPLDNIIIKINSRPLKTSPPILFNKSRELLYNKNVKIL